MKQGTQSITLEITNDEMAFFEKHAKTRGITKSQFILDHLKNQVIQSPEFSDEVKYFVELHKYGLRLKFLYAIGGLVIGGLSIIAGTWLFLGGVLGKTSFTFEALGLAKTSLTDAGPGAVLFVIGLFFVIFTRLAVSHKIANSLGENHINYHIG